MRPLAAFSPETAQRVLGEPGSGTAIDVGADAGCRRSERRAQHPQRAARRCLRHGDYEVDHRSRSSPTEQPDDIKDNLSFFNTFLLVFALVALFVGSFIIYNTFSIIVAQRGRELALLRALGASGEPGARARCCSRRSLVGLLSSILGLVARRSRVALGAPGVARGVRVRPCPPSRRRSSPRTIIVVVDRGHGRHVRRRADTGVQASRIAADARRCATWRSTGVDRISALLTLSGSCWSARRGGSLMSARTQSPGGAARGLVGFGDVLVFIGVAMLEPAGRRRPVAAARCAGSRTAAGHAGRARPRERDAQPAAHRRPLRRRS